MDNIIINFQANPDGLQPGIKALEDVAAADKNVEEQAKKTMDTYSKRSKDSKKSIDELATSFNKLDKSLVGGIGGKALDELRKNIKLTDTQWKAFYQNIIKTAKTELISAKTKEDFEQLNQLINGAQKALDLMGDSEDKLEKKSTSMKARLRELKLEMQQLEDSGQDDSAAFEKMAIEAGKLQDQIGDTDARIRAMSSDTFVFDALISGVTGLTGAFAAAQGFVALFGDENEDLQRALLKVNAAMSILQGLQAVQNVLQKQSAASIGVDLLLRRQQTAATTAQTLATETQTVAQKGLNLAMLATPQGLLIGGIAAITTALFAFGGASKSAKEDTDRLNESLQTEKELLDDLAGDNFAAKLARLRLRLKGASDKELFQFDVKEEERKLAELKTIQVQAFKERADFEKKIDDEFTKGRNLAEKITGKREIQVSKEKFEELEKQGKIHNEKVANANEAVTKQEEKLELLKEEHKVKIFEDAQDKKKNKATKTAKEIREEEIKARNDADVAAAKSAVARTEGEILLAKKGSKEELALRLKLTDQIYFLEVVTKGKTVGELEKIDAEYFTNRQELFKKFNQQEVQDAINSRIAIANSTISNLSGSGETNEKLLKAKEDLIDAQADLDAQSIRESEENEELRRLKIKAVYDKALSDKRQLEKDKTKAEIDSLLASELSAIAREQSKNKKKAAAPDQSEKEKQASFEKDLQLEEKAIEAKRQANFNLLSAKAIDNDEFRRRENELDNAQDEIDIKREQAKQDRITEIKEFAFQQATNFVNLFFAASRKGYDQEMQQVKDLFDQKRISQTEYDNRVRQLRRRQAVDEKAQAVFSTLLQQGPVILEGFKKGGFFGVAAAFSLFFSMLSAVTAVDVPKFRKGKVRIDGPGTSTSDSIFARISRNESVINADATQKHEAALRAINEDRFDDHLKNYELPRLYQNMNMTPAPQFISQEKESAGIDYSRMAAAFATELANNPQAIVNMDEEGIRLSIRKGNQITEYKNKKLIT